MSELQELIARVRRDGHASLSCVSMEMLDELRHQANVPRRDERGRVIGWDSMSAVEFFAAHGIKLRHQPPHRGVFNDQVELVLESPPDVLY